MKITFKFLEFVCYLDCVNTIWGYTLRYEGLLSSLMNTINKAFL